MSQVWAWDSAWNWAWAGAWAGSGVGAVGSADPGLSGLLADLVAVLTFQSGYNTNVVLAGTIMLGMAAGLVGAIVFLRKRSMMSDSISHSTLPGVGLAFLVGIFLFEDGRVPWLLMAGAAATALTGVFSVQWIRDSTRLPEDTAIGTVLSVYYGIGVVVLSVIQALDVEGKAGLNGFLIGSVASLRMGEAWLIAGVSLAVCAVTVALRKEFLLLCFDRDFATASGWPVRRLDLALMGLLLVLVSVGLKTVGMVLIIAIVIIPPAAARFWTDRIGLLLGLSALFGALSTGFGVALSAVLAHMPTGAVIVLTAGTVFIVSLLFGAANGVLAAGARQSLWRFRLWEFGLLMDARSGHGKARMGLERLVAMGLGILSADGRPTTLGNARLDGHIRSGALVQAMPWEFRQGDIRSGRGDGAQ